MKTIEIIPGAETVAAEILGRAFESKHFRYLRDHCHNPVIIVESDGMYIGPDSSLVPNDGIESDMAGVGELDANGTIQALANRVNDIPDSFWDRHPKMQDRVEKLLRRILDSEGESCAEYISELFADDYASVKNENA